MIQICGKCQAQYQMKLMGVTLVETAGAPPRPFRLWKADSLACPICHAELISNLSHEPMMESHEDGFDKALAEIPAERRRVLHNPAYLAQTVGYETKYVRQYVQN